MFPAVDTKAIRFPGGAVRQSMPSPDAEAIGFPGGAVAGRFPIADVAVVRFPPLLTPLVDLAAVGSGTHAVEILVFVEILAPASGSGTAENVFIRTIIDAPAEGGGTASAALTPVAIVAVAAAGTGAAGVTELPIAVVIADAAASGSGSALVTVGAVVAVAATAGGTASNPVALAAVGTCAASGSGTAGNVVTTFKPSGMTKNGSVAWAGSAAWVTITNWTPNTGTYPGSSVDGSHRLVVQGNKTGATINGQAAYTGGGFARTHSVRLVDQAGNVLATGSPNTNTSGTCTVSATGVNLSGITAIALQMSGDFSAGTLTGGATTFLTIT